VRLPHLPKQAGSCANRPTTACIFARANYSRALSEIHDLNSNKPQLYSKPYPNVIAQDAAAHTVDLTRSSPLSHWWRIVEYVVRKTPRQDPARRPSDDVIVDANHNNIKGSCLPMTSLTTRICFACAEAPSVLLRFSFYALFATREQIAHQRKNILDLS
jgi:hypothetical protein